jgi:hypothetical protein
MKGCAGGDGPEYFALADGGEAEVIERWNDGVGLGGDACKLSQGFDHENAWHQGLVGEVASEKGSISWEGVSACGGLSWEQRFETVNETEFRAMRQGIQG